MRIITSPGCTTASPTRKTVFNLFVKWLLIFLFTTISVITYSQCRLLNENFNSNPVLSETNVDGTWYPDRYRPSAFVSDILAGENVLKISIDGINDGAAARPTGYQDYFYNTQGRKFNQCGNCVTALKGSLFIPADWATKHRRSDMWATAYNASNTISIYPIIGFRNPDGNSPGIYYWDGTVGWINTGLTITYDTWYHFEFRLNGTNLEYLVNNTVVGNLPSIGSAYFGDIIMQAYNFNDVNMPASHGTPDLNSATNSYDAYWDNLVTTGVNGNVVTNITTGITFCSIQVAINAANPNDVIQVAAGTYTENITVNKSLTIKGANADISCSGTRSTESILAPASGVPVTITADGVTLNGFEITAPNSLNAVSCGSVSTLTIKNNNIHHVGSNLSGEQPSGAFGIMYIVPDAISKQDVLITDNCLNNIGSSTIIKKSPAAIGILQSSSTGTLTGLNIERNTISNVNVSTGDWDAGGRIAYGIQINTGGSSSYLTTGKVVNAVIKENTISSLTGFIATGIALEGNTENAMVDANTVSGLTGYKLANRAGGGYDLQALKFENNRYVSTVTVQNNSFNANTFNYGATPNNKGYAVANYVPVANGGIASLGCNWYGTANYGELVAEYTAFTGKIFNKDGAGTDFVSYSTVATPVNCLGVNATPANLMLTYEHTSENVIVNFDVAGNASAIYPIPGLNPSVPADLTAITAKYVALQAAIAGGNAAAIKAAALEIGDDILTEYYYLDGTTKVYLKTAGGNNLIKNKYWDKYLNNTASGVRYPSFADNRFIVPIGTYSTSTNPNTGGTVNTGWLSAVYGKTLYVTVTFLHNGEVFTATQSVAIPAAPVVNTNTGLGYLKIQTAINDPLTLNGHTITVAAGTYAEDITVNKSLDIRGPNYNISPNTGTRVAEAVIVPATSDPNPATGGQILYLYNTASGSSINGFVFDGDNPLLTSGVIMNGKDIDAVEAISGYHGLGNVTIKNNIIKNLNYSGIDFYNYYNGGSATTGNIITDNLFDNIVPSLYGIGVLIYNNCYTSITDNVMTRVRVGIQTGNFSQSDPGNSRTISNNNMQVSRRGIFHNLAYSNASAFTLSGNTINSATSGLGSDWDGILLSSLSVPSNTVNNIITGPSASVSSQGYEIWNVKSNAPALISGGSVTGVDIGVFGNNFEGYLSNGADGAHAVISGVIITPKPNGVGVKAFDSPNYNGANPAPVVLTIQNDCSISNAETGILADRANATVIVNENDNTITGNAVGIDVTNGASATIHRNTITDNGIGVRAATGGTLTAVTENFITSNTTDGIKLEIDAGTVGNVETNDLSGNTGKAINNLATATFDATCNWFGTVDATAIAAKVNGLPVANYTPYLTNGTDANPGTAGFQNTSCRTVYHADPMLIDVVITSQSPCPQIDPNKLPLNSYSTVRVNLVNLDEFNAIPGGTTTLSVQLGNNFDLKPGFVIANAGLNNYFDWTYNSSTHTITGVQKINVSIPEDFIGYTEFEIQATPSGTNTVVAEFQVTNHGPDNFLVDDNTGNNEVETNYTVLSALTISLSGSTNVSCNGGANGSITVTGSGGATPYEFSIDNGNTWLPAGGTSSAYTFNNLLPGTYTVIIRDFVCVETTLTPDVNISQPAAITALSGPSHIATAVSCNGGSNGAVNLSFTATGGTGALAYAYAWTKQGGGFTASTEDISNLTAGVYHVTITVTDANNCVQTFTHSATVTEPSILVAAINGTHVTCFGGNNGTVTASATGGTPNYSYAWNNGPSTPGQTGLAAGTYTVTITDANGCQDTETFVVNQPSDITLTANTSVVNISCNGQATGTINLTATAGGGTPGYTYAYSWTASNGGTVPSGQVNAEDLSGLTPGTYTVTVTVTDNNNCVKQFVAAASAVISQAAAITVQSGPSFNITQVKCKGGNDGIIDLSFIAQGGTGALSYSYLWTKVGDPQFSSTNDDLNNLTAGTYNVVITVTDDNNCTATFNGQAIVTEPANALIMNSSVSPIACAGTQGSVTVTAFGGTAPYQFSNDNGNSWQGPAGNTYTFNMPAGPYSILVKDANGCLNSVSGTLTQPANTDISIGSSASGTLFSGSVTERSIIFNLSEIAGKNATPVTLRIFKPSGYDIVFDNTLTAVPGPIPPATISVDNTKWQLTTSNGVYYDFTRTAAGGNNTILCNQIVRVVFTLRRNTTSTGSFNLGSQFRAATGELITVNNGNSLLFTAQ